MQLLATNQAQDMQRVNAVLDDILNRNQNSEASEAEEVELPVREVLPGRVARVDVDARGDENRGDYSMARELGKEIPTLTHRNYSLWKEHVLAYGRAAGWGTSDIPEVLTGSNHLRAKEAKDFLFIKLGPTLQRRILHKNITTAADLWSYLTTAVADEIAVCTLRDCHGCCPVFRLVMTSWEEFGDWKQRTTHLLRRPSEGLTKLSKGTSSASTSCKNSELLLLELG